MLARCRLGVGSIGVDLVSPERLPFGAYGRAGATRSVRWFSLRLVVAWCDVCGTMKTRSLKEYRLPKSTSREESEYLHPNIV